MTLRYVRLDELPAQARAVVRLFGPDTARFVQGTLTADVGGAPVGEAVASALCTAKGKIVSELVVLRVGDEICDLLIPAGEADTVAELLDRHIIMDQVQVQRPPAPALAVVWTDAGAVPPAPQGDVQHYAARHPGPGALWLGDPAAVQAALAGAEPVDAAGWARRRIDTATPAWGHEITADVFPAEVGFVYAVSYSKGCFLGQEPLARIHARGQVNRVMVRLRADVPLEEDTLLASDERPEAGRVTTVAPDGSGSIALGIVRRDAAVEGTRLRTDAGLEVVVTSGPLGDDPGVTGKGRPATVKLGGGPRR